MRPEPAAREKTGTRVTNYGARRITAACIAIVAALCAAASALLYAPFSTLGPAWKPVAARVLRSDLAKTHDFAGRLLFQVRTVLQYEAEGSPRVTTAVSPVATRDFARSAHYLQQFSAGTMHTVYYKSGAPDQVRLGSELGWFHARKPLAILAMGLILALLAVFVALKAPPRDCASCGDRIKSYYKFCPSCATPVHARAAKMPADVTVQEPEGIAGSSA